jgi:hypothetical protein
MSYKLIVLIAFHIYLHVLILPFLLEVISNFAESGLLRLITPSLIYGYLNIFPLL